MMRGMDTKRSQVDDENELLRENEKSLPQFYSNSNWAPCSIGRACSFLMIPFVIGLVGLTYVPYVRTFKDKGFTGFACLMIFHILLALMIISYFQVVSTDPGTVPRAWHDAVVSSPNPAYKKCRHTSLYRPLRSHYCSITRRTVLNFDHFCPWVANAVGFKNRKFFVLFCFYSMLTAAFSAISLGPVVLGGSGAVETPVDHFSEAITLMAFIMDVTFSVALAFFCIVHFYMAARNQTSLEDGKASKKFDLGWFENLQTVFGRNEYTWFLPWHQSELLGDGVHWKLSDGSWVGHPHNCDATEA